MKRYALIVSVALLLLSLAPAARADKADVYLGYSRVGANLYGPYTPGMNGWQAAAHYKPIPFVGIEADVSRYSGDVGAGSAAATLVMFGPRVTAHALGFSVFAHGLAGNVHYSSNPVAGLSGISYNALSYAAGGGADLPIFIWLKLRATGDYLGQSKEPSSQYSPSQFRAGIGLALHF